jgi:hypothetical protein
MCQGHDDAFAYSKRDEDDLGSQDEEWGKEQQ